MSLPLSQAVPPVLSESQLVGAADVPSTEPAAASPESSLVGQNIQPPTADPQQSTAAHKELATAPRATPPPLPPVASKPAAPAERESFEMRLGTYWLVRIGIVAMLTALVFFGTYAYQNFVVRFGPAGKVVMLYLVSGALLGFGAWFQRRAAKESLRNYAHVLFAGGMAAVYFTTYAAHHFPNLRVIGSATLDGFLLLGWAGFMAWMADRRKSEVFAVFAVGLAYYTSFITHVGHFTLYSNLVLAAAVLFFLVRNRWAAVSFGSLVATYASYGFWRFYSETGWHWAGPDAGLWMGVYFLAAYWVVFTAAVFLSQHKEFVGVNRASFATLNNAAFLVMFLLTLFQVHSGGFWRFSLCYGTVLLGASLVANVRLGDEPLAANTYLTQGLLLATVGIIAKFSGLQLALLLGLESVVLWMLGTMRQNIVMRTGACVSAALAALWAFDGIRPNDVHGVWLGAGTGGSLAFNAFWSHWYGQGKSPQLMRSAPTYFSAVALLIWTCAVWQNVEPVNRPAACAIMALALALSVHATKLRELSLLAQLLLPLAVLRFIANQTVLAHSEPWWAFACVAGASLALTHWWQRQTRVEYPGELRNAGQFVSALALVGATAFWLEPKLDAQEWVLAVSALTVAITAYAATTRNWVLALTAQIFIVIGIVSFGSYAGSNELTWLAALAPLGALTLLGTGGRRWADACPPESKGAQAVREIARWYGRVAMALLVWWTFQYAATHEQAWSFTALGAVAFVMAGWRSSRDFLVFATVLDLCALCSLVFLLLSGTAFYWLSFVAVLVWMIEQQVARRQTEHYQVPAMAHNLAMVGAGVALWWLVSRWVLQGFSGFYLTASWSAFAFTVFAAGMALRERMYRWLGLGVLGAALARVVIFDVWRLETIYRIVSFFALGLVLLVLGFIYNKYQERIRQWL